MKTILETKYLNFVEFQLPSKKTKNINVVSKNSRLAIGEIKWYGPWRQYTFFPEPDTIWNVDCLNSINEVIRMLMDERR
jgi:hypothetical protein